MPVTPLKGALAKVNRRGAVTQRFDFALNPEQIHRRIHWPETGETTTGARPCERLSFRLALDASDALKCPEQNPAVVRHGVRPQLTLLESFIRPSASPSSGLPSGGNVAGEALAPALVFLWGQEPAVPVRMVSLNVREELFDPMLNPLSASVRAELEVLSPDASRASFFANLSKTSIARMRQLTALTARPVRDKKRRPDNDAPSD